MVANPMQKRARNSFLLGMVITLIVCVIIGALLYFLFIAKDMKGNKERGELVTAYVLNQDVKSGDVITPSSFKKVEIYKNLIPRNYIDSTQIANMEEEYVAKVDLYANTVVTSDVISKSDQLVTADTRYVEYNMLSLPTTVAVGDYIDVRLTLPNGQDLIVVSKKEIISLIGDTIGLQLSEGEILMMESAIVEAYKMTASKLYVIQYVEPGNQTAATKTYTPTTEVQNLISVNANIKEDARNALKARFDKNMRGYIDRDKGAYAADAQTNLEEGIQKEIENAKAAREAYLSGLTSYGE